jgi:hypothetical protein
LEPIVKKLGTSLFKNKDWNFQQDSATTHEAKIVKSWVKKNFHNFISNDA